jgi:Ca2+-binding RTX toxin-like protein
MPTPILGAEFTVDGGTDTALPTVTALANGRFAIAYTQLSTSYKVAAFDAVGSGKTDLGLFAQATTDIDNRVELLGLSDGTMVLVVAKVLSETDTDLLTVRLSDSLQTIGSSVNLSTRFISSGLETGACIVDYGSGNYSISFLDRGVPDRIKHVDFSSQGPENAVSASYGLANGIGQLDATLVFVGTSGFSSYAYTDAGTGAVYSGNKPIGTGDSPSMTSLEDGDHATVYRNGTGVHLNIKDSNSFDERVHDVLVAGSGAVVKGSPSVLALDDNRMLVVWSTSSISSATMSATVAGRIMNADGSPNSGVFVIDGLSGPHSDRSDPDVLTGAPRAAQLADGRIVVTWQDGFDGNVSVRARYIDPRTSGVNLAGTDLDDQHVGTAFADTFIEGRGNDKVEGAGGADRIFGGNGNDTLDGGDGNDLLDGGIGSDLLIGGTGNDIYEVTPGDGILEAAGGLAGTADLIRFAGFAGQTYNLAFELNVENLTLAGDAATNGIGNGVANIIVGNAANNVLAGGGGKDTLNGGAGNDTYSLGGDTTDVIIDGAGSDTISSTVTRSLAVYATIENLALAGTADINGTGNGLANSIVGNSGKNALKGGAQNDVLRGGLGTDAHFGEAGNDRFVFVTAAESVVGAARDIIYDLDKSGMGDDVIDLRSMAGVDTFIGIGPFTAAGQVRIQQAGGNVLVQINTAGTSGAESEILLVGATIGAGVGQVNASDFML